MSVHLTINLLLNAYWIVYGENFWYSRIDDIRGYAEWVTVECTEP